MFGSENIQTLVVTLSDPGADDKQIHLMKAPRALEILSVYIVCQNAQGAGSAGEFTLQNWDTTGTAIKSTGGTVVATLGGTASASRLAALTPTAGTISEGTMAANEWLVCDYQEVGDFVEGHVTFSINYVLGVGA